MYHARCLGFVPQPVGLGLKCREAGSPWGRSWAAPPALVSADFDVNSAYLCSYYFKPDVKHVEFKFKEGPCGVLVIALGVG